MTHPKDASQGSPEEMARAIARKVYTGNHMSFIDYLEVSREVSFEDALTNAISDALRTYADEKLERAAQMIEQDTIEDVKVADPDGSLGLRPEEYFSWRQAQKVRSLKESP